MAAANSGQDTEDFSRCPVHKALEEPWLLTRYRTP